MRSCCVPCADLEFRAGWQKADTSGSQMSKDGIKEFLQLIQLLTGI